MTISVWVALPFAVLGLAMISYGLWPHETVVAYEGLRREWFKRVPNPLHRLMPLLPDAELIELRSEIIRLVDILSDFGRPIDQRDRVHDLIKKISNSNHRVWLNEEELRRARKQFVHWCDVAQSSREQYGVNFRDPDDRGQTLYYLNDAADRLDAGLKGEPVRSQQPYNRSEGK